MSDLRLIIDGQMRAMTARIGCFDAVAETINARWGASTAKGTISRKVAGSLDWGYREIIALEDALGCDPVTRTMYRRNLPSAAGSETVCPISAAAVIYKETGEAVSALLAAAQSDCAGDRAEAYRQLAEAKALIGGAMDRLEAMP